MRCRKPTLTLGLAACLAITGAVQPAFAAGLVPTERVAESAQTTPLSAQAAAAQRVGLLEGMVAAGVDRRHAQARLDALTDADIGRLSQQIDTAPAGGMWFAPFLLVAVVIGALIGSRSASANNASTDLFGRPRNVASAP